MTNDSASRREDFPFFRNIWSEAEMNFSCDICTRVLEKGKFSIKFGNTKLCKCDKNDQSSICHFSCSCLVEEPQPHAHAYEWCSREISLNWVSQCVHENQSTCYSILSSICHLVSDDLLTRRMSDTYLSFHELETPETRYINSL